MNILGGIKSLMSRKSASSESRFFGEPKSSYSSNFNSGKDFLNAYELCNYLGNLISIIAGDISRLDWEVIDGRGKVVDDPSIMAFIQKPGSLEYKEFTEILILHYILDGNVFVGRSLETARDVKNKTAKLRVLIPALVDIYDEYGSLVTASSITNSDKISKYYVNLGAGGMASVNEELIIHVKALGSKNTIRGMGKVQQNAALLDSDRMTSIFNNMFFQQGARVSLIVTPKENLSTTIFGEYIQKMRDVYEGARNHGKIMFSPVAGEVKNGNITQNDMQFIEQRKLTRDDINDILQVPAIRLAGREVRFDSAKEQLRAYYEFCLPSYGSVISAVFGRELATRTGRTDLKFKIKYPAIFSMDVARDLFDRGSITQNEYREMFGKQKMKDKSFDERFMTMQYIPVSLVLEPPVQAQIQVPTQQEQQIQKEPVQKDTGKKRFSRAEQYNIHKQATLIRRQCEKRIQKDVRGFYDGMRTRILDKIKSTAHLSTKAIEDPFDIESEIINAKNAARPMHTASITLSMNEMNRILDINLDSSTQNKFVRLVVEKLGNRYATQTMNSRYEELRTLFGNAQEQGQSISEIAGTITEYFEELSGENAWKATRIARTEAFYAWDQAAVNAYNEIGVTIVDVIGCEDEIGGCNRQNIPIDEAVNLEFHPNHTGTIVPQI